MCCVKQKVGQAYLQEIFPNLSSFEVLFTMFNQLFSSVCAVQLSQRAAFCLFKFTISEVHSLKSLLFVANWLLQVSDSLDEFANSLGGRIFYLPNTAGDFSQRTNSKMVPDVNISPTLSL